MTAHIRCVLLCGCLYLLTAHTVFSAPAPPTLWTVRQAVDFALANNPDAGIARQRILGASAQIEQARSAFRPTLGLGAEYSQTDNPMYSFGNILNQGEFSQSIDFNDPGRTDNLGLQARLQYRFYNGGQDEAAVRQAMAGKEAGQRALEKVHALLAYEVVRTFHSIIQTGESVQARESAVQAIAASVTVARARFEAGDLLQTDLLNLEVQHTQAEEQLIQARHHHDLAQRAFLNLLGLEQGAVAIDAGCDMGQEIPGGGDVSARPELLEMEARVRATEAALDKAGGGKYPSVDGFAGYQVDKGFETNGAGDSWMAGVKVNYDLYNGGRTDATVAVAQAELAAAREGRRKLALGIGLEVEQARLALKDAEERLQVTGKLAAQAEESARLSRERFKEGVLLSSEVIDVENRLTEAKVHDARARGDRSIAVAALRRAIGLPQFAEQGVLQNTNEPLVKGE